MGMSDLAEKHAFCEYNILFPLPEAGLPLSYHHSGKLHSPKLTSRLHTLALESLFELGRIVHRALKYDQKSVIHTPSRVHKGKEYLPKFSPTSAHADPYRFSPPPLPWYSSHTTNCRS